MVNPVVQDFKRLQTIARVLTKHGFSAVVRQTPLARYLSTGREEGFAEDGREEGKESTSTVDFATRFRYVLQELGPTYVKLGQVMSTRVDLFPPELIQELTVLRDKVAPVPFDEIETQIEKSLGGKVLELFEFFEEKPIAAASIGQVHKATTHQGEEVVVKVQRPGIQSAIAADIDILYMVAAMLEATIKEVEIYRPRQIIKAFERAILSELDFREEARNSEIFAYNFADIDYVRTPKIYHELTCDRVLTQEYIEELPLSSIVGGSERAKEVLSHILDATVKQVMYDGFFHGDPHPGNIFVDDENRLIYIDFGLVGRLTSEQQDIIIFIIISAMNRDVDGLARVLFRMGDAKGRVDLRAFKSDISEILDEYLVDHLNDINIGDFIQECTKTAQRHGMRINANYAVLTKVAATIEGIMRHLDPELDLMKVGRPYAQALARERFSPERLAHSMTRAVFRFSASANDLPQQLEQVLLDLESGTFEVRVRSSALDELGPQVNTLGTRLLLSISASGVAIVSAILLKDSDAMIFGASLVDITGVACFLLAGIFFFWSLGWHIFGGGNDRRVRVRPWISFFRRSKSRD